MQVCVSVMYSKEFHLSEVNVKADSPSKIHYCWIFFDLEGRVENRKGVKQVCRRNVGEK